MYLLFKREQTPGIAGVTPGIPGLSFFRFAAPKFKLWAKVELDREEKIVLSHYRFDDAILIDSYQPELLRKTAMVFAITFVVVFLFNLARFAPGSGTIWGTLFGAVAAWFYFDRKRETIFVKDLLHGRNFSCKSVIDLARKEAWLETVVSFLRQVMETAKHWDGIQPLKVEPLPKDIAKQIVIKGL